MSNFKLAEIFSDNMVLQREKPIKIWGTGKNGLEINVQIKEITGKATVKNKKWEITFNPMKATENCQMEAFSSDKKEEKIIIKNVAIGEVWIAGGQSNMEFPMKLEYEFNKISKLVNNKNIRFFDVPKVTYPEQTNDFKDAFKDFGVWYCLTPKNIGYFSAIGYYFSEKLFEKLSVPIGIIGCTWGGTSASVWQDENYLKKDIDLNSYIEEYEKSIEEIDLEKYETIFKKQRDVYYSKEFQKHLEDVLKTTFTLKQLEEASKKFGMENISTPKGHKSNKVPGILYKNMVKKIAGYSSKGVIWYQGENDEHKAEMYFKLFSSLIKCWRDTWREKLPFLFVQLASFESWAMSNGNNFPRIREEQERVTKKIENTYMVSIMDCGQKDDIHPKQKRAVGERLALLARGKIYNEDILCESPEIISGNIIDKELVLNFKNVNRFYSKDNKINGFELKIDDKEINKFEIILNANKIILKSEDINSQSKIEVKFAWVGYLNVNIYSEIELPLKPFKIKIN